LKSYRKELWFNLPTRRGFINITPEVETALRDSGIQEGLALVNAGVTLPHGIGMTISDQCPQIMHGESLAVTYPEFTRFTYTYAISKFAAMGRIFQPDLKNVPDEEAAARSCEALDAFLKTIGMWLSLKGLGASMEDVSAIADNSRVLPDYKNNPRIADREEIYEILLKSYDRK
jgi:alcohol dehydrogenase